MLFQLQRILFSYAVYIKTQSDVTILEASNALPLLQMPFWIVYNTRSSVHFIPVDRDIPPFHVFMDENSSRLAGILAALTGIPIRREFSVNWGKT